MRLIDLPVVRNFWTRYLDKARAADSGRCLVCGQEGRIARIHEAKIKGIPGWQTSGTALVSFNKEAFESYGLTQSYNAPVCYGCAEGYAKGLNRLIQSEDTSLRLDNVVYVFWAKEPPRFSVARLLGNPEPQYVKALLESPWKGKEAAAVQTTAWLQ